MGWMGGGFRLRVESEVERTGDMWGGFTVPWGWERVRWERRWRLRVGASQVRVRE